MEAYLLSAKFSTTPHHHHHCGSRVLSIWLSLILSIWAHLSKSLYACSFLLEFLLCPTFSSTQQMAHPICFILVTLQSKLNLMMTEHSIKLSPICPLHASLFCVIVLKPSTLFYNSSHLSLFSILFHYRPHQLP